MIIAAIVVDEETGESLTTQQAMEKGDKKGMRLIKSPASVSPSFDLHSEVQTGEIRMFQ